MGSLARHLVIPTLKTDFHREGIFRPSANRKRLSFAPTLTLTLTLGVEEQRRQITEDVDESERHREGLAALKSDPPFS